MQTIKLLTILMVATLIGSCFYPWVTIESKNIVVSGFDAAGTTFGKPGLFHVFLCSIFLILLMINRNWSKRAAFFVSAFNIAWAVRNFVAIPTCQAGICPVKHAAIYILLISSILITVLSLFTEVKPEKETK